MQRSFCISAQSSQCDTAMSPSTNRLGFPLPDSSPLASKGFASNDAALVWRQGLKLSGLVARPLLLLIGNPVPLTGGLGFSLPAAGRLRVLRKMEDLGEAKVPPACPGLKWRGFALGGGHIRRRWLNKYCYLRRLGNNRFEGPPHS